MWTRKLYDKDYVAETKLRADELEVQSLGIQKEKAEIAQLRTALNSTTDKIAIYQTPTEVDYETLFEQLELQIASYEILLNYTDVEGPGVIVIIDDADRELHYYESENSVLVHDKDVSAIVDELRKAGAEAISINGERIIFNNTRIVCVGPTVLINGEQMTAPFIIKAIGNRKHLEAAINAPDTYAEYLANFIFVEVNTSVSVEIDKYDGEVIKHHADYYEEGDN